MQTSRICALKQGAKKGQYHRILDLKPRLGLLRVPCLGATQPHFSSLLSNAFMEAVNQFAETSQALYSTVTTAPINLDDLALLSKAHFITGQTPSHEIIRLCAPSSLFVTANGEGSAAFFNEASF